MGWKNIFNCEIDPFCQKILKQHFPNAKQYYDIKKFNGKKYCGKIDIISGGFPCQPFSVAGKRKGSGDDRHLWPEMLRVIREIKPRFVVGENVGGLITWNEGMVFDEVLSDLENEGYEVQAFIIPACAVNAPHRRDRVWIIANNQSERWTGGNQQGSQTQERFVSDVSEEWASVRCEHQRCNREQSTSNSRCKRCNNRCDCGEKRHFQEEPVRSLKEGKQKRERRKFRVWKNDNNGVNTNTESKRPQGREEKQPKRRTLERPEKFSKFQDWKDLPQPGISRGDDGFSDRIHRTKALGNAIVPEAAYRIFKKLIY